MTPMAFCAEVLPTLCVEVPSTLGAKSEVGITTTLSTKASSAARAVALTRALRSLGGQEDLRQVVTSRPPDTIARQTQ